MRILHQDRDRGLVKLRPDSLDDLWHLHHIVEEGDTATAFTHRRQEEAQDKQRAGRGEKVGMTLGVLVEEVEFHEFSNRLRVRGPIVEGPEEHGAYHTLNIEEGKELTIVKPGGWRRMHLERIQEAVDATERPRVTFLSMEDDEATLAVLRQYGVQEVATLAGPTGGKMYEDGRTGTKREFWGEIVAKLQRTRPRGAPLVVVGPGFAKEDFLDWAQEHHPDAVEGALVEGTGQAGMTGVQEAMKRGLADRVAKDARVARETKLVEGVFEEIAREGPATYGVDHVDRAIDLGAVEMLLVTDELVREGRGEELLDRVEQLGGEGHVVSTKHEAGEKLEALGGAAAKLRYRVGEAQLGGAP